MIITFLNKYDSTKLPRKIESNKFTTSDIIEGQKN